MKKMIAEQGQCQELIWCLPLSGRDKCVPGRGDSESNVFMTINFMSRVSTVHPYS